MQKSVFLELHQISKRYGPLQALEPLNLKILEGERVALIGPSGAGKSTLLGLLSGSIKPDTGTYSLCGASIEKLSSSQRAQSVGLVRQRFDLVGPLKTVHNVLAGNLGQWSTLKSLLSLIHPQDVRAARQALKAVGIEDKLYEKTQLLSGGEQQRVALARLLVQNPKVILADEPVASLDPARADQVMDLLVNRVASDTHTLVASLHSVELAQKYFNRIIGLREGKVWIDKPAKSLTEAELRTLYSLEQVAYG